MLSTFLLYLVSAGVAVAQPPHDDLVSELDKARLYWSTDRRDAAIAIYEAGLLKHRSPNELNKTCDAILTTVSPGDLDEPIRGLTECAENAVTEWLDIGSAAELRSQVRYIPRPINPPHLRNFEGFVDFEFDVTPSGLPRNIVVLQSTSMIFERSARNALEAAKFRPARLNGVSTWHRGATIRIDFKLEDQK